MKAKVLATLYVAEQNKLYKVDEEVDISLEFAHRYPGFFEMKMQKAPENKMITPEKETVKTTKRGRPKSG